MESILPHRQTVQHTPSERSAVEIADDDSATILEAVASETARTIVASLQADPATASDIAEAAETSVQNVQYHLERLCEAGLVEPLDVWYSEKGVEMTVYGLAIERLVVEFGDSEEPTREVGDADDAGTERTA